MEPNKNLHEDPEKNLDPEFPLQDSQIGPMETNVDSSVGPDLDGDSNVTYVGQFPNFQEASGAHFPDPYQTQSPSFGASFGHTSRANLPIPVNHPIAQWDAFTPSLRNPIDTPPLGTIPDYCQVQYGDQMSSSPVLHTSLSEYKQEYTPLLESNNFPYTNPSFFPENTHLPLESALSPAELPQQNQCGSPNSAPYIYTPTLPTPSLSASFTKSTTLGYQPSTPRRTNSMMNLDAENHVKSEERGSPRKKPRGAWLIPPLGSSPGLTDESPRSPVEFVGNTAIPLKRKRTLSADGKRHAGEVRKQGACGDCRRRKVKCRHVLLEDKNPTRTTIIRGDSFSATGQNVLKRVQSASSSFTLDKPASNSRSWSGQPSPIEGQQQVVPKNEQDPIFSITQSDEVPFQFTFGVQFPTWTGQDEIPETLSPKDLSSTPSPSPRM